MQLQNISVAELVVNEQRFAEDADLAEERGPPPPPDGGYGWVCVVANVFLNAFTWGVVASYGVYLSHYLSNDVFSGGTSLDFAFVGGLNFSMAVSVAPVATAMTRIYGSRPPMLAGVMLLASGYVCASFAQKVWQLYLSQGVLVGIGVGFIYIPSAPIISQWFSRKRSLANGICAAGSGIGGLTMSFATQAMINNLGVAWSLRITAVIVLFANFAGTMLIRNRNSVVHPKLKVFDRDLVRRYDVLLLLCWSWTSMLGFITLLHSLADYARFIGLSETSGASIVAFVNLGTALGRPCIGVASDKFGRIEVAGLLTLFCGVICFAIWIPATSFATLTAFALLSGAVLGVFWVSISTVAAEVVGLKELPSLLSIVWIVIILPTAFSEVIALKLRRPGSYLYPKIFAGTCYLVASLFMLELYRIRRRRR